jgi:hypothetical protein
MRTKTTEQSEIIRKVENSILDQRYKQYALMNRPPELAIPHLLKMFGHIERDISNSEELRERSLLGRMQFLDITVEALGYCLRWTIEAPKSHIYLPKASWFRLDLEAQEFLGWGINYARLVCDHIGWSRGFLNASVDQAEKKIRFSTPDLNSILLISQASAEGVYSDVMGRDFPFDDLEKDFGAWSQRSTMRLKGFDVPWALERDTSAFRLLAEWSKRHIWSALSADTDLHGYTLGDFRSVYTGLLLNGFYHARMEDLMDARFGSENEAGSVICSLPQDDMCEWLSEVSGVERSAAESILKDLTFDTTSPSSLICDQPFVRSKTGMYFLLMRLLPLLKPDRTLAGALHQRGKEDVYANIVQDMEQSALDEIEDQLRDAGLIVLREESVQDERGQRITPDFLVCDDTGQTLLVLDYKHALAPRGAAEVSRKLKAFSEWEQQVRKYVSFLRRNMHLIRPRMNIDKGCNVRGVILFGWPTPLPTLSTVDAVDWVSMKEYVSQKCEVCAQDLIDWIAAPPHIPVDPERWRIVEMELQVADWTYVREIVAADA